MKKLLLISLAVILIAGFALAQTPTAVDFDKYLDDARKIFEEFLILGASVVTAVALLKRWLKTEDLKSILLSVGVSAVFVAVYLIAAHAFEILRFIIESGIVALAANGIYLWPRNRTANSGSQFSPYQQTTILGKKND